MKIALIHHILGHKCFSENLEVIDKEFCLAPPLILAYVAAILEKAGHEVILVDANALKLSKEKTLEKLKYFSPDIICFRADSYWFHRVVEWATYFKANLEVKVIVGGINVNLYPRESLLYDCFDYGIMGEANESLPHLLSALDRNQDISNIEGLIYKEDGKVKLTPSSGRLIELDEYPFPARHLLPNHLYQSFTSQLKNFTIMITSTGCPYDCSFCAIHKLPFRQRSYKNVVDEIEECYQKYNVHEIDFFDATFFIDKKKSMDICDEIVRRGIKIEWSCRSRIDIVDKELLEKAAKAGCKKIYYGIESVSAEVLNNINKNIDEKQIVDTIALTQEFGIMTLGFFMVGNLGDTPESVLASINFAKKLKLDFIQVCKAIAKPNTELNNILIRETGIDYWREYISGRRNEARFPTPWSDLSEHELEKYTKKFYRDFYFRPSYIVRRIRKTKSMSELMRYIKVGLEWFFCNRTDVH